MAKEDREFVPLKDSILWMAIVVLEAEHKRLGYGQLPGADNKKLAAKAIKSLTDLHFEGYYDGIDLSKKYKTRCGFPVRELAFDPEYDRDDCITGDFFVNNGETYFSGTPAATFPNEWRNWAWRKNGDAYYGKFRMERFDLIEDAG